MQNRSFVLVARPDGMVRESDFALLNGGAREAFERPPRRRHRAIDIT